MSRELLQQALDALEWASDLNQIAVDSFTIHDAITALRSALAAPAAEPVPIGRVTLGWDMVRERMYPDGENNDVHWLGDAPKAGTSLYATPQQAQPAENPWKDAVLDRLASASIDAPTDEFPSRILDRIIEVEVMIALAHVPDGWVMVPREPTQAMCAAAVVFANGNAVYKNVLSEVLKLEESIYAEVYEAMIAAAPAPVVPLTDDMVEAEFVSRGDDKGQGLHPYWKDAFRDGFNFARSQLSAAPVVPDTTRKMP